jgi:hypothetical protein
MLKRSWRAATFASVHTQQRAQTPSVASGPLGSVLNVEASDLAVSKTEDVSDRLVLQPVRLPLEQFAFEIADYFAVSDND